MKIIDRDPWLKPFEAAITGRHQNAINKETELVGRGTLKDFAAGHQYFGLHQTAQGKWVFREWAPNATAIYLIGDFNNWQMADDYKLQRIGSDGIWEITLPRDAMHHGQLYKMLVQWQGGQGERIPAWAQRVVQDDHPKIFSAGKAIQTPPSKL